MAIDFPNSPSNNDIYTVNGKRWIYSSGKWSIYGSTSPDATASDTEPTGVGDGHIWYRSDQSQTLIRYDNTWVEVGSAGGFDNASTSFPTSLDSATGFAAVEALQAKVGVDSSAVTTSHDYKIADHASRLTTLEALGQPISYTPTYLNLTVGNGTVTAKYALVGNIMTVTYVLILGSTTVMATNPVVSLPSGYSRAVNNDIPCGVAMLRDTGTANYVGFVQTNAAGLLVYAATTSSSWLKQDPVTHIWPHTWAATDQIRFTATLEVA